MSTRSLRAAHARASSSASCALSAGVPGGEAAVRAVEAAVRAGLGAERAVGAHELVDDVVAPEPGGDPEVARVQAAALGEQLRGRAVAPEERRDERRAAVAAPFRAGGRAGVEEEGREPGLVRVRGLVQRRPAVRVRVRGVGAAVEQEADRALVARRRRHAEEVVAVRAARVHEAREAVELRGEGAVVVGLEGAVGAGERLAAAVAQRGDVAAQRGPRREAVQARDDGPRAVGRRRRAGGRERGDRARRPVLGRGAQPLGAAGVVVEVGVVGELEAGPPAATRST